MAIEARARCDAGDATAVISHCVPAGRDQRSARMRAASRARMPRRVCVGPSPASPALHLSYVRRATGIRPRPNGALSCVLGRRCSSTNRQPRSSSGRRCTSRWTAPPATSAPPDQEIIRAVAARAKPRDPAESRSDIVRDIGDGDDQAKAGPVGSANNRIVEVARIFTVDGDGRCLRNRCAGRGAAPALGQPGRPRKFLRCRACDRDQADQRAPPWRRGAR